MPKGNKSKKKEKHQEDGAVGGTITVAEDDSESVCSSLPDSTVSDEVPSDIVDDSDSDSELQFQLSEHIDQLLDKNSRTRISALKFLKQLFQRKLVAHLLIGREETISDVLVKGLRKYRGQERCDLLLLSCLLAVQCGETHDRLFPLLQPFLLTLIKDHTVSPVERSTAVSTSVLLCFLLCHDFKEVESIMHECESIMHSVKIDSMVAASVKGWSLLLSIIPNYVIPNLISSELPHLSDLLEKSSDLSVKIAIGQAIALLLEIARETDDSLMDSDEVDNACDVIQTVATESNRYTGRKERSQQRSCFKDLVSAVETGDVPERRVKLGSETLLLNSWAKLVQYNAITELLGSGTANQLQSNDLLRDVFQLGPVISSLDPRGQKVGKIERKLYNAACAKYRSQARGKQRDKRSVL